MMLQPLHKLSRMSPPCLLCNYILHWGSPRCSPSLVSENGEEKGTREKKNGVQLNKGRCSVTAWCGGVLRVGVLLRMMGILLPGLLQRRRGLRGICLKSFTRNDETFIRSEKVFFLFFYFKQKASTNVFWLL